MLKMYVRLQNAWARLKREQDGLTTFEYGVILAFVVVLAAGAFAFLGTDLKNWIETTWNKIKAGG